MGTSFVVVTHSARVCVLLVFLSLFSGVANADLIDKLIAEKTIKLAHREASFPFSYVNEKGQPVGYTIDICKRFVEFARSELKLDTLVIQLVPVTSASRISTIQSGAADIECGSTTNNSARRKHVDFTVPHFVSAARFLVRTKDDIKSLEDLRGKKVVSTKGTTNLEMLNTLNTQRMFNLKISAADDHAAGFAAVAMGAADAFAMDNVLLYGLRARAKTPSEFSIIGKSMSVEPYAIMFRKDEPRFKKLIDRFMVKAVLDGELSKVYSAWFLAPIPPNGIKLDLPMSNLLKDIHRVPTSNVHDWYLD